MVVPSLFMGGLIFLSAAEIACVSVAPFVTRRGRAPAAFSGYETDSRAAWIDVYRRPVTRSSSMQMRGDRGLVVPRPAKPTQRLPDSAFLRILVAHSPTNWSLILCAYDCPTTAIHPQLLEKKTHRHKENIWSSHFPYVHPFNVFLWFHYCCLR